MVKYIGNFPPPYGGVTRKNKLIFEALSQRVALRRPSAGGSKLLNQLSSAFVAAFSRTPMVIGISSAGGKSLLFTRILYHLNRKTMNRSLYFMMGGTEAGRIAQNPREIQMYAHYRQIYVETRTMKRLLDSAGMENVSFFPNCRTGITQFQAQPNHHAPLRCLFFSRVELEKGIDLFLDAAQRLPEVSFDIFGELYMDAPDLSEYRARLDCLPNVRYHGCFQGGESEIYELLHRYDIMLFPTRWKTEGVPGVLVEAKIAAVPAIVSDVCYNAEIVEDGVAGIVLKDNTADDLVAAIRFYDENRDVLTRHKEGALHSAETYLLENYIDEIAGRLRP